MAKTYTEEYLRQDGYYVYSTKLSPGNQGVFQLLKEVTYRRIPAFYNLRKWGHFGVVRARLVRF